MSNETVIDELPSEAIDEKVWNAWVKKGIRMEHEHAASRTRNVKWICVVVLVGAAVYSASFSTAGDSACQLAIRFVMSLGCLAVLMQSLRTRQYAFTALFGVMLLLFNPLVPAFSFAGQRLILAASLAPFFAALIWMREKVLPARAAV